MHSIVIINPYIAALYVIHSLLSDSALTPFLERRLLRRDSSSLVYDLQDICNVIL